MLTGVINGVAIENFEYFDDDFYDHSINLSYIIYANEHIAGCSNITCIDNDHIGFLDSYENNEDTYLINYIQKDGLFIPDKTKDYSCIFQGNVLQITYSKYAKKCLLASPCYPSQVDLRSKGDYIGYCLPPKYFINKEFTSLIYKIDTKETI